MDYTDQPAFASFDPDETGDGIRQVHLNGWIKVTSYSGHVRVMKVETVKLLDSLALEVTRPGREDRPVYKRGYLGSDIEPITEHEALAFLAKRHPQRPLPEEASHE